MRKRIYIFTLIVGSVILFYTPFLQNTLFKFGEAKVYSQDFVTLFFMVYIVFVMLLLLLKNKWYRFRLKSTKYFILFLLWGIFTIIRSLKIYGFHTIGEARGYIFIMFYFFFIILAFSQKKEVVYFLKRVSFFIIAMLFSHFIQFYFLDLNFNKVGRSAFRFINATEALLVSFMLIWFLLNYINNINLYSKKISYILLSIFLLIIVIVQHRSIWLATFGGLLSVLFLYRKIAFRKILLPTGSALILFFILVPFINNFIEIDLYSSIKKSIVFLQNPEEDATGSWRLIGWKQELEKIRKQPVIGEGLGGYSEWFVNGRWLCVMVHNGYIMNLAKFGIIGIFLISMGIFYWYKEMNEYIRKEKDKYFKVIGLAMEICLFMHLIYVTFYSFTMFFWIILGLASSMVISSNNELKTEKKC